MMKAGKVQEHFAEQASEYEQLMGRLVPQYKEQNSLLLDLIPYGEDEPFSALDLGCGPGVLTELLLEKFSNAQVAAFDLTQEMLTACEERLAEDGERLTVCQGDFQSDPFGTGYDLILASLSLQHLTGPEKEKIYDKVHAALNPGGLFLAREITVDVSTSLSAKHYQLWRDFMKSQGEDDAMWYAKHKEKDHPVSLADHLLWMKQAGFVEIGCHYQYLNFAIMSGRKEN